MYVCMYVCMYVAILVPLVPGILYSNVSSKMFYEINGAGFRRISRTASKTSVPTAPRSFY